MLTMRVSLLKASFGASLFMLLASNGAHAGPVPGTYQITVNAKAVDGSAPPTVKLSSITGAPGQQWIWNGTKFTNIQSGALLADNGNGAPTENSAGDTFNLLVAGSGWNIVDARTGNYLGILNNALSFNKSQKSSWLFTGVSQLNTPDGVFSWGAACTGSDCPAAEYHAVVNNVTQPDASGICFRMVVGTHPYMMDAYGEWSQWNPSTKKFASATAPGFPCNPLPYSGDGSNLTTPGTGTLVTADGTWSLGTNMCGGSYQILLNGTPTTGCGTELLVANDGVMYTADAGGYWWEWVSGGWTPYSASTP
jgi:hypothetical protein